MDYRFRLTVFPALELKSNPNKVFEFSTDSQMLAAQDAIADMLLFLQDYVGLMPNYSKAFIMEEFIEDEWCEYEDYSKEGD